MKSLFTPCNLAGRRLANRIAMAPMTRARIKDTVPDDTTALYYAQRADAGLITTECIAVSEEAMGSIMLPGLWSEAQIAGWKKVTKAVHDKGGVIFAQIWHAGRASHSALQPKGAAPVSSSDKLLNTGDAKVLIHGKDGKPEVVTPSRPRGLTTDEVSRVTADFVKAAENALKAGFDGVELHAANGYLFEQFLNPAINDRSDKYGGSIENRLRFLLETLEAVSNKIGPSKLGVRLSPFGTRLGNDPYPEAARTYLMLACTLNRAGLAYVSLNDECSDASCRRIPHIFLRQFRSVYNGTVIYAGSLNGADAQRMLTTGRTNLFKSGLIDIAAFGRPYIANPDLVNRLRHGWPLAEPDPATFFGGGTKGYTDYPVCTPPKTEAKRSALAERFARMEAEASSPGSQSKSAPKTESPAAPKTETKPADKAPAAPAAQPVAAPESRKKTGPEPAEKKKKNGKSEDKKTTGVKPAPAATAAKPTPAATAAKPTPAAPAPKPAPVVTKPAPTPAAPARVEHKPTAAKTDGPAAPKPENRAAAATAAPTPPKAPTPTPPKAAAPTPPKPQSPPAPAAQPADRPQTPPVTTPPRPVPPVAAIRPVAPSAPSNGPKPPFIAGMQPPKTDKK